MCEKNPEGFQNLWVWRHLEIISAKHSTGKPDNLLSYSPLLFYSKINGVTGNWSGNKNYCLTFLVAVEDHSKFECEVTEMSFDNG